VERLHVLEAQLEGDRLGQLAHVPALPCRPGTLSAVNVEPSGRLDGVAERFVIEHVSEQVALLEELARALSPSGMLAISSPNRDALPPGNPPISRSSPRSSCSALCGGGSPTCSPFASNLGLAAFLAGLALALLPWGAARLCHRRPARQRAALEHARGASDQ
jgi:SAM-dependent methyltransferase